MKIEQSNINLFASLITDVTGIRIYNPRNLLGWIIFPIHEHLNCDDLGRIGLFFEEYFSEAGTYAHYHPKLQLFDGDLAIVVDSGRLKKVMEKIGIYK